MRCFLTGLILCSCLLRAELDPPGNFPDNNQALTAADVQLAINAAAHAVNSSSMVIAVTDRQGNPLAVFRETNAPAQGIANFSQPVDSTELAVALARTASFFSNSEAPLSSRTVRFISGIHFPPGIMFVSNAALYGIENTNRGCPFNADYLPGKALPPSRSIDGTQPGLGILTGKKDVLDSDALASVNPGGVPLYKGGRLVGGIGVTGVPLLTAEYAALVGAVGSGLFKAPAAPAVVIIAGISLPFVNQATQPAGTSPVPASVDLLSLGAYVPIPAAGTASKVCDRGVICPGASILAPREHRRPSAVAHALVQGPQDSPGPAPEGYLVAPHDGPLGGLTASDVQKIVENTLFTADQTRAQIRLPIGTRARFVITVADLDGKLLVLYRMRDATIFSVDVSVGKARNVIYFTGGSSYGNRTAGDLPGVPMNTAVTNRSISFGAQPFYPPGIDFTPAGPFFDLYKFDTANPCTQGAQVANPYQNGIVFFPGALPLYRNGKLVGGLGVSGDGVDQDDFATGAGGVGYEAPDNIRADTVIIRGVRLPYIKFPRNPTL